MDTPLADSAAVHCGRKSHSHKGHSTIPFIFLTTVILLTLLVFPSFASASTYFDFRSSTGTVITTKGDGTVCVADRINCKYVVINLGHPTSDLFGIKYYQLNTTNFNIMGNGCTSGALDIAVYNDAAYTQFDHQFALAGSGTSPLPASSNIQFTVPADKYAQLIFGCNDGGINPAVATIDGGPGLYQSRDINSITYTGLPSLCIGDTPADCGSIDQEEITIAKQSDGSVSAGAGSECNNLCSNVVLGSQVFLPSFSAPLGSIEVFTSNFGTASGNPDTNNCFLNVFNQDTGAFLASSDNGFAGFSCAGDLVFTFNNSQPVLSAGFHYRWEFTFGGQNFKSISFFGSATDTVGGSFSIPPLLNAKFTALAAIPPPSELHQSVADGRIDIPAGGITTTPTILFSTSFPLSFPEPLQLQVELRPTGIAFTGSFDGGITASVFVAGGVPITLTRTIPDGLWHWRARFVDKNGNASNWTVFNASETTDFLVQTVPPTSDFSILAEQGDGSIRSGTNTDCNNSCPDVDVARQIFTPIHSGQLLSVELFTANFSTASFNPLTNTCSLQLFDDDANIFLAQSDNGFAGPFCAGDISFSFASSTPPLQIGKHYRWDFHWTGNFTGLDFFGSPNNIVGGIFTPGPVVNAKFIAHGVKPANPAPSITSVSPSFVPQGISGLTFSATGTNFQSTATLSFNNQGVSVGSYLQRTATQIVAAISVSNDAQPGSTDVTVTNPDGQTSTLAQGFTVIAITPPSQRDLGGQKQQQTIAEPVSTGTGNYYYQHLDFTMPERGKPLRFERSYNTLDNYEGPLGANWTHSYNITLTQASNGTVGVKWGDGHVEVFTSNGSAYLSEPGVYSALSKNGDGSFTLITKDQTHYSFSSIGKLTSCTDRNGNTTTLAYDGAGNLIQVADPGGRILTFSYDSSNRITTVTDPARRSESFAYDSNDNLVQATDPAGGVTALVYDGNHHVLSITLPNGNTLLQNTYDVAGRVTAQTNGLGRTWTFSYGMPNAADTTITDARGNATIHTYDALLRIMGLKDALGGTISFAYDGNNNRTSATNQNGNTTTFSYDSHGNITAIKDPTGSVSSFTYDSRNSLLSATDAKGNPTVFGYDGNGNLMAIQDALGHSTKFLYDGLGQMTSKKDAAGNTTTYAYDEFGNLTSTTDALGDTTSLGYDAIGRLVAITDANGHTSLSTYDFLSRLVAVTDALNDRAAFSYDPVGNLLTITDANGNTTNYSYDSVNNLVGVADALGHLTKYSYDENNNRTAFINAKGNTTFYTFDPLNRLTAVTDPLAFATAYAYDVLGNVVAVKDANGNTNRFSYDALNRLITISYGDDSAVGYAFDANGNRTMMTDAHGRHASSACNAIRASMKTKPLANSTNPYSGSVSNCDPSRQISIGSFWQRNYTLAAFSPQVRC